MWVPAAAKNSKDASGKWLGETKKPNSVSRAGTEGGWVGEHDRKIWEKRPSSALVLKKFCKHKTFLLCLMKSDAEINFFWHTTLDHIH